MNATKQVETAFDALNDLHTELQAKGVTNENFIAALEQIRDVVNDEIVDDGE